MSNCHKFACSIPSLQCCGSPWPNLVLGHFHIISTKHNAENRSVRDGDECVEMCTICRVQNETCVQIKKLKITFHVLPFSHWEKRWLNFFWSTLFGNRKMNSSQNTKAISLSFSLSHAGTCTHTCVLLSEKKRQRLQKSLTALFHGSSQAYQPIFF